MNEFLMNDYQISDRFVMHWFGNTFSLYNISRTRGVIKCNRAETCVILTINRFHNLEKVWQQISSKFRIDSSSQSAVNSFSNYVKKLISKGVIISGKNDQRVFGVKDKFYPFFASVHTLMRRF